MAPGGPLAGYRVLGLAGELAALCGKMFADLGADVVKVEPPGGCPTRSIPYLSQTVDAREAHRLGMVNRVVPRDQLDDSAEIIAQQIAQAPLSVLMGSRRA